MDIELFLGHDFPKNVNANRPNIAKKRVVRQQQLIALNID
ncbi:hypothetical protein Lpp22_2341 [Lacticaseibacillus paracasei subsp. paracasei Lpp22]|uniref:Uncharacterized protein n=1 Tax=Lacticaseibacillus paracasei subsp. paracasei Lpp22 TaxID=1256221 RepID=A0A8E0I830_LACPA|nr:hypothetical protein Lpp22_2341 [Lacticaseibacillus paracasei subsp. paracasei Lpp22]